MQPYAIISDPHYHSFSAFAEVENGINTRLAATIAATHECVEELRAKGGDRLFLAGDIFHKRGEVAPSVLNPVMDMFRKIVESGIKVYAIPGNHDLEGNDSMRVANAVTALESVGVTVAHHPMIVDIVPEEHSVCLFPWYSSTKDLIGVMESLREEINGERALTDDDLSLDAIIHAPVDGVLPHLPAHGLEAGHLSSTGFDRVFAGHYHNHKFLNDGVYSVGALTHQTWGDIGSTAGFMLVYPDREEHYSTSAPEFVELTGDESDEQAAELCKGNFVRVRVEASTDSELKEIRQGVLDLEAKGVNVIAIKKTTVTRSGVPASAGTVSLEASIKAYLDKKGANATSHALALDILSEARAM